MALLSHLELKGKVLTRDLSSLASSAALREATVREKSRDLTFFTIYILKLPDLM